MSDIYLPQAGTGSAVPQRGLAIPDRDQVPTVAPARDPGLTVPAGAFDSGGKGLEALGEGIAHLGHGLAIRAAKLDEAEATSFADKVQIDLLTSGKKDLLDSQSAAADNPQGFADTLKQRHDERANALMSQAPSPLARQKAQHIAGAVGADIYGSAAIFEHNSRADFIVRQTGDSLDKLAAATLHDPDGADNWRNIGVEALRKAHEADGLTATSAAKLGDVFDRKLYSAQVNGLIDRDPAAALKRLQAGEWDKKLGDPALIEQLQQHADAREKARQAEVDRVISGQVRDATYVLDHGQVPPQLDSLQAAVKGSSYEQPLREAVEDRAHVADFIKKPMVEQTADLDRLSTAPTADRRTVELSQRLQRANDGIQQDLRNGRGLEAAQAAGVIEPLSQLNPADPVSLATRAGKASVASDHFGYPVSPLTKPEISAIRSQLDTLPADQATALLSGLRHGLGEDGAAAVAGNVVKEHPELAYGLSAVADRPELVRDVIAGGRLLKANGEVKPAADKVRSAVSNVLGNAFEGTSGEAVSPLIDAATALYANRRVPGADLSYDADAFETALKDVAGQPVKLNGRMILPPVPGMDGGQVRDLLTNMGSAELAQYGNGAPQFGDGKPFTSDQFKSQIFGNGAQLVSAGIGTYRVLMPGLGYVGSSKGGSYVLDLGRAIRGDR